MRTNNKRDPITLDTTLRFKFIKGKVKGKEQVESSIPSAPEEKELEVLGEHLNYEPLDLDIELVVDEG